MKRTVSNHRRPNSADSWPEEAREELADQEAHATFGISSTDFTTLLMFIATVAGASVVTQGNLNLSGVELYAAHATTGDAWPSAAAPPLAILIAADGQVQVAGQPWGPDQVAAERLSRELAGLLEARPAAERTVLIVPDQAAPWRSIAAVELAVAQFTEQYHTVVRTAEQVPR